MNHQRLGVADVGQQREELQRVNEFLSCLITALNSKGDQAALTIGKVFLRALVVLTGGQARIVHPLDAGMPFQKLRHAQRILRMPLHAKMQRLYSLQEQEGVEG